jgi:hypothetical protein
MDPRAGTGTKDLDLLLPTGDAADEVVGGGVHGLDRQAGGGGELHQPVALFLGPGEAYEVDVLGHPAGLEPQGDERTADEEPVTLQPVGHGREHLFESLSAQLFGHGSTIGAMNDAWEVLAATGMPVGAIRPAPRGRIDPVRLRAAVAAVAAGAGEIDPWHVEPLLAWLRGFKHHWPASFAATLGPAGEQCLARLEGLPADSGRYLKLRRIAIENLSYVL